MKILVAIARMLVLTLFVVACGERPEAPDVKPTDQANTSGEKISNDTINQPRLVMPEPDGSLLLTAEKGKAIGPAIKYMPEWRAFGWFTSEDRVEWEADVASPGTYDVFLEWSVSDEEAGKEFLLQAGDQQITGIVNKSGSWETFKQEKIGSLTLEKGKISIVFRSKSSFAKEAALLDLRKLKLVKS